MDATESQALNRLIQEIAPGARLCRAWPLRGGASARLTALDICYTDAATERWVIRQHGAADRQRDPQIAEHEFALLVWLRRQGLPVPAPRHLEARPTLLGAPFLVIEYCEGSPALAPADGRVMAQRLAALLARLHALEARRPELAFLPDQAAAVAAHLFAAPPHLDDALSEGHIRAALTACWPPPTPQQPALLHGDFWPGNVLWQDDEIGALIDWEDAALGDPLADLANARLELLWAKGWDAMLHFTETYQKLTGIDLRQLAIWDLVAALRPAGRLHTWGLDAAALAAMRAAHQAFVDGALQKLVLEQ